MEVPNKIYVRVEEMGDIFALDATTWNSGGKEYIRKDDLLEWAEDAIANLSDGSLTGYYESLAYQDLIDKLNSL